MRAWLILAAWTVGDWITSYTYRRHLTTDPACKQHRPPRSGSALDRHSRGVMCNPCMVSAAFGDHECRMFTTTVAQPKISDDPSAPDDCSRLVARVKAARENARTHSSDPYPAEENT